MSGNNSQLLQKVGAEMVGTFALVFAGCGAIMVDAQSGVITHTGVGLVFGTVIMVMVYATGHISGAHFNPAVTIAFAATRRFPWREVPYYIIGQVGAALIAALALNLLFGPVADVGATFPSGSETQSLVLEMILTFFLMFVIAAVATDSRAEGQMAGLAIGGTVALAAIFGGPISGASLNPARSIGPALVAGNLDSIWLYLVGPIVGAVIGAFVYRMVCCSPDDRETDAAGCC
jgi:MIP family channel proteins